MLYSPCGSVAFLKKDLYNNTMGHLGNTEEMQSEEEEKERKQFAKMTRTPVAKLVVMLGIPTMLNMMVSSLYNLADTYFVSGLGESATGAVNVVLSLMSIIQAIGFTFGMGGGSIISRLLGKRAQKEADEVSSSAFFAAGAAGVLIMIFGLIFLSPLMRGLGATALILPYAKEYSTYILLAAPFMCMSFVMNNLLRSQGKALLSMIGLVTGAVINVALDPILIFGLNMGITGAAVATFSSQLISFFILLFMFLSKKSVTHLRFSAVSKRPAVYGEIVATGFPSFCRQILASLCTVLLNWAAQPYESQGAIAALGVVQKVFMFAFSISLGIGQGFQPVLGYNYSARRFDRVRGAYLFTLVFSTALMSVFAVVCAIAAPAIMRQFLSSEKAIEIGTLALRLQCICMPLLPLNFMAGLTYQVVGNKALAALLSCSRQGLFYIPAVLVLPQLLQLLGIQSAQSVSDFLAFLFAIPFTVSFFKRLRRLQEQEKAKGEQPIVRA